MIKNHDIICISTTDWSDIWGSRQHIMQRLARHNNRILFVETQVGPEHIIRDRNNWGKFKRWSEGLVEVKKNIWAWSPPLLLPGRYYSLTLNLLGQKILVFFLRKITAQLGFKNPILWIYQPNCSYLIGKFNEKLSLYYCIDEYSGGTAGRKKKIILSEEMELIKKADLVFIHNKGILERKGHLNSNTHLMPSAADIEHYSKVFEDTTEIPEDIKNIKHPIIGQVGNFTSKCDIELLYELASSTPEWSYVVIGQVYRDRVNTGGLENLANFHFLGKKDFKLLPNYQKTIDICIIPYIVTDLTMYISPLKLYEYMACGKPIVSTALPEAVEFEGIVKIGNTAAEFRSAIKSFLESDITDIRKKELAIAEENSWNKRTEKISSIIEKTLEKKH